MYLLHPTVAPWLVRAERGWHVALLTDRDDVTAVYLRALPDNEEALVRMHSAQPSGTLFRWDAILPRDSGNTVTRYAFKVLRGDTQVWLAADGQHPHLPASTAATSTASASGSTICRTNSASRPCT